MHVRVHAWESGFDKMADHLRAMMEDVQSGSFFKSHHPQVWKPALNLYETRDAFVVCVELAGMSRERIEVTVDNNLLIIRGDRDRPVILKPQGDVCVHLMEIDSGQFQRQVQLPADAVHEKITATYRHGYLWITLPRASRGEQPTEP